LILYQVVRGALVVFCRAFFRLSTEGREHIPREGAFVFAPVHRSFIDFALVASLTTRRIRYMGKAELWGNRAFGALLSALGAFPVHRGGADREALRRSIELAQQGEPLVIFPEGTRRSGPTVKNLYEGAAYVAARTGIPVVPVGIGGSELAMKKGSRLPRPVKIHLVIGPPLPAPVVADGAARVSRRSVHELTEQIEGAVQRLFDDAQRKAGVL
jgi:1-acyl-sn-glycerol-3-phosphate acyltransferase